MKRLAHTPFGTIFRTEVLLNTKRLAPYAMALLFGGNALLWWGWGPAESRGLATNSEHFIAAMHPVFSFMTLPFFTALIMGDPVIRDFRAGVAPLIFSKPVGRATYLLGKFSGNFFVLVCCQAVFPLTFFALQWFRKSGMMVQPPKAFPYLKHFLIVVVVSHLLLAALYFTVGALTRNARLVYALAVFLYPIYIAYQVYLLKGLPPKWRVALDPLLMNWSTEAAKGLSPAMLNRLSPAYGPEALANRALMLLAAAACLTILYARFSTTERQKLAGEDLTTLDLAPETTTLYEAAGGVTTARAAGTEGTARSERAELPRVELPRVRLSTGGFGAGLRQFAAALSTEFRLLRSERSLVIIAPVALLLSLISLAEFGVTPGAVSYSAAYAARAADSLLIFLFAAAVFYTGEAMHRDRELRVEPLLWSAPSPDAVLVLSKFTANLLLSLALVVAVCLSVAALQLFKGHGPVAAGPYLSAAFVVLLPGAAFMVAAAVALNVLLREKHLAYVAALAACGALIYAFNLGFTNPLYNPVLYQLWTPADLAAPSPRLLAHRLYTLALAAHCLALAHLFFGRKFVRRLWRGDLAGLGWPILAAAITAAAASVAGFLVAGM